MSQLHYGECTTCRQHHYSMEHVPYLDSKATLWRGVYHAQAAMQGLSVRTKELSVKDQSLEKFNQGLQAFCLAARFPFLSLGGFFIPFIIPLKTTVQEVLSRFYFFFKT